VFAAADVQYLTDGGARAALVMAVDVTFSPVAAERTVLVPEVAPYQPGEFFRRELPPLRAVLADVLKEVELLIIDGYVDLDTDGRPGLGAYAHQAFGVPIVGVAKTRFATATHAVPVLRGNSARPLFVTAAGIPKADAAAMVAEMAGSFRLPDALRRVDALARLRASVDAVAPTHRTY
jgi:deoxyribonuclease V